MISKLIIGLCMLILISGCNIETLEPHKSPFERGLNVVEKENKSDWQIIWEDDGIYVDCCMDKQFEEIPEGEIYCETATKYTIYCDWNKGEDEKWREYCNSGMPIYTEKCYTKNESGQITLTPSNEGN